MYNIVDAIYQMLGNSSGGSGDGDEEEEDPKDRVDRIFEQLDKVIKSSIYPFLSSSLFLSSFSSVFLFLQVIKFVEPDFINEWMQTLRWICFYNFSAKQNLLSH